MRRLITLALGCMLSLAPATLMAQPFMPYDEAAPDTRQVAVDQSLAANADAVVLYARGLCCSSCAIGVRKKVTALAWVDQARLADGVNLDPQHQLVTVAVKKGASADARALALAIKDAGYDPVSLWQIVDGKTQALDLEAKL